MHINERENDLSRVEWSYDVYSKILIFLHEVFGMGSVDRDEVLKRIREEPSLNYDDFSNSLSITFNWKNSNGKYDQFLKIPSLPYRLTLVFAKGGGGTKGSFRKVSSKEGLIHIYHNSNDILSKVTSIFDSSKNTFTHELNHMYDDYISYDDGNYTEYRMDMNRMKVRKLPSTFDPKYGKAFWDYKSAKDGYREYRQQNAELNVVLYEYMTSEYRKFTTGVKSYKRGLKYDFEDTRSLMYAEGYLDDENANFDETLDALYRFSFGYCDRSKFLESKYKEFENYIGFNLTGKLKKKVISRLYMFYDKVLNKLNLACK